MLSGVICDMEGYVLFIHRKILYSCPEAEFHSPFDRSSPLSYFLCTQHVRLTFSNASSVKAMQYNKTFPLLYNLKESGKIGRTKTLGKKKLEFGAEGV